MSFEKPPMEGVEIRAKKEIDEGGLRPSELNDPAVSEVVDRVEKYIKGESTGYFHHGSLVMDTEKAFKRANISLDFLEKWIPDWESKLANATLERDKKQSGSKGNTPDESILKASQAPRGETVETEMSPEEKEKFNNAILLIGDGVGRHRVPDDFMAHLEKGDRVYCGRSFPSLDLNDSSKWTNRDLFLLWQGVVALKEQKDAVYRERDAKEIERMKRENELVRVEQEHKYRKERNISDEEIAREASFIADGLSRGDDPLRMNFDEFVDWLGPYFERGNHPDYSGYSGEDLRSLCLSIKNVIEKKEKMSS